MLSQVMGLVERRLLKQLHGTCSGSSGIRRDSEVIECITLEKKGSRTVVTGDMTIKNSGVSWFAIRLLYFSSPFGKFVGKDKLKEIRKDNAARSLAGIGVASSFPH